MTRPVESNPSVQVTQPPSERARLKFGGRRRARFAGLFAAGACLLSGGVAQAAPILVGLSPNFAAAGADSPSTPNVLLSFDVQPCSAVAAPHVFLGGTDLGTGASYNDPSRCLSNYTVTLLGSDIFAALGGNYIATLPVTVVDISGTSNPLLFTVFESSVDPLSIQTALAPPASTVALTSFGGPGLAVSTTLTTDSSSAVDLTVATYNTQPAAPGTLFQVDGGNGLFFDILAPLADYGDSITATFYYPNTITGATESNLKLLYFDPNGGATQWPEVKMHLSNLPGTPADSAFHDYTDGAYFSGGSFTATFDGDSAPSSSGFTGTIFTLAPKPLNASPSTLWPPNHRMVPVTVDAKGGSIVSVSSNEPQTGMGNGDLGPDSDITGPLTVNLRAERGNTAGGRIYTILVQCSDGSQNIAVVRAPHARGNH